MVRKLIVAVALIGLVWLATAVAPRVSAMLTGLDFTSRPDAESVRFIERSPREAPPPQGNAQLVALSSNGAEANGLHIAAAPVDNNEPLFPVHPVDELVTAAVNQKPETSMRTILLDDEVAVSVDEKFAAMVERYNKLYDDKRFADAEELANEAKRLWPDDPVSEVMFWKARFGKRMATQQELNLKLDPAVYDPDALRELELPVAEETSPTAPELPVPADAPKEPVAAPDVVGPIDALPALENVAPADAPRAAEPAEVPTEAKPASPAEAPKPARPTRPTRERGKPSMRGDSPFPPGRPQPPSEFDAPDHPRPPHPPEGFRERRRPDGDFDGPDRPRPPRDSEDHFNRGFVPRRDGDRRGDQGEHHHGDASFPQARETERRVQQLQEAAAHLREAGMHNLAKEADEEARRAQADYLKMVEMENMRRLEARREELARRMIDERRRRDGEHGDRPLPPPMHDLHDAIRSLREEVQGLRGEVRDLKKLIEGQKAVDSDLKGAAKTPNFINKPWAEVQRMLEALRRDPKNKDQVEFIRGDDAEKPDQQFVCYRQSPEPNTPLSPKQKVRLTLYDRYRTPTDADTTQSELQPDANDPFDDRPSQPVDKNLLSNLLNNVDILKSQPRQISRSENLFPSGAQVAVLCYVPDSVRWNYEQVDREVEDYVARQLKEQGVQVVDPAKVRACIEQNPEWEQPDEIAAALDVTFMVYVELNEFSLYEKGSASSYQGGAAGKVSVLEINDEQNFRQTESTHLNSQSEPHRPSTASVGEYASFKERYLTELGTEVVCCVRSTREQ